MERESAEYDPDDVDEEEEEDESLIAEISRTLHEIFKSHGIHFLKYFDTIVPGLISFLVRRWMLAALVSFFYRLSPLGHILPRHKNNCFGVGNEGSQRSTVCTLCI